MAKNMKISSFKQKLTIGQRAADGLTKAAGSWWFIFGFGLVLFVWIAINILAWSNRWDPYPFILLNLVLSCLAAVQAPIILMSQNRMAERDRAYARYDYQVNRKAEREIQDMKKDLDEIKKMVKKLK